MPLPQYNNIWIKNPLPLDAKYLNGGVDYATVAEANATIPIGERHPGLKCRVAGAEYWYDDGITDEHLVLYSPGGNNTGDGSSQFFTPEEFGAKGDGTTDDSAAWATLMLVVKALGGTIQCKSGATYLILTPVNMQGIGYDKMIIIQGNGCRFLGNNVFVKTVANQTAAANEISSTVRIFNANFVSKSYNDSGTITGVAIHLRCSVFSVVEGCRFMGYEYGAIYRFCLFMKGSQNRATNCKNGFVYTFGDWTGATNFNSQSNVSLSIQERFYGPASNTTGRGISFIGVSDCKCLMATIEGNSCQYGIYFDNDAATVVMDFHIDGLHIEGTTVYDSWIYFRGAGNLTVERVYQQTANRTLKVIAIGYPTIEIAHWPNASTGGQMKIHNDSASNRYYFHNMPSGWTIDNAFETTGGSVKSTVSILYGEDQILTGSGSFNISRLYVDQNLSVGQLVNMAETKNMTMVAQPNGYMKSVKRYGTYGARPALGAEDAGHTYVASDYGVAPGEPTIIFWTGTEWKPVTGSGGTSWAAITDNPIPADGAAHQYLKRNAANNGYEWNYLTWDKQAVSTATATVAAGKRVVIVTGAQAVALTMPAAASVELQDITIVNLMTAHEVTLNTDIHSASPNIVPAQSSYTYYSEGSKHLLIATSSTGGGGGEVTLSTAQTLQQKTLGTGTKIALGSDAQGDLYQRAADGTLIRIALGASGTVLKSNGTQWVVADDNLLELQQGTGITISGGTGLPGSPKVISATGSAGSNPLKALSIESYGGVADLTVSGTTMSGTNNSTALVSLINASSNGQELVIPHGNWYLPTRVTLPTTKSCKITVLGNLYAPNGVFAHSGTRYHEIRIHGEVIGRLGVNGHSRADYVNRTGMNDPTSAVHWDNLIGSVFEFTDVYRGYYYVNYATGYQAGIHFKGGTTANEGGQELTVQFQYLNRNKYGIWLQSMDGSSYIDKITFSGPNGGTARIAGHQVIFIDGHTSETGAARSNNFVNLLTEFCNFGIKITGDATYNKFIGHRWEGGAETGHFGSKDPDLTIAGQAYINIKNTAVSGGVVPRGTQFIGCSHVYVDWLQNIGNQVVFVGTPIWNRNAQVMFGSNAVGKDGGKILVTAANPLSTFSRSQLPTNVDYIAYGPNTPNPATDSILYRDSTAGVEYIQKWAGGTGGGQWTDHANGVWYNGKAGIGVAPDANANLIVKAGSNSVAPMTIQNGALKTTARNNDFENDGQYAYFTLQNQRKQFVLEPAGGGGAYQMLRKSADGSLWEYIKQPVRLFYNAGQQRSVTSNTVQSIIGSAITLPEGMSNGDLVEMEGSGKIVMGAGGAGTATFSFVAGSLTVSMTATGLSASTTYNVKFRHRAAPVTVGTNVVTMIEYRVRITNAATGAVVASLEDSQHTAALNTTTPTFNLTAQFSVIGHTMTFNLVSGKILRGAGIVV